MCCLYIFQGIYLMFCDHGRAFRWAYPLFRRQNNYVIMTVGYSRFAVYLWLSSVATGTGLLTEHDQFYILVITTVTLRTSTTRYGHGHGVNQHLGMDTLVSTDAYICQGNGSTLIHVMTFHMFGTKPSPKTMLIICQLDAENEHQWNFN